MISADIETLAYSFALFELGNELVVCESPGRLLDTLAQFTVKCTTVCFDYQI